MIYKVKYEPRFKKSLKSLDIAVQKRILLWIEKNLYNTSDPHASGKALVGKLKGYWRYRIGDYRLIVEIRDEELIIIAVDIGHRKEVYK